MHPLAATASVESRPRRRIERRSLRMTLRIEFEPLLISWYGFHRTAASCKAAWDARDESQLKDEIARATEWLSHWPRTAAINRKAGASANLKHVAERWHQDRSPGCDYYIGS